MRVVPAVWFMGTSLPGTDTRAHGGGPPPVYEAAVGPRTTGSFGGTADAPGIPLGGTPEAPQKRGLPGTPGNTGFTNGQRTGNAGV
ncbi:hypothetical protein GCM10010388_09600 [Streptomyces mauvecolor]